jgi:hypothetical protein
MVTPIFAYIDPMSGAIVFQLLLATCFGVVAFFRRGILGAFRSVLRFTKPKPPESE